MGEEELEAVEDEEEDDDSREAGGGAYTEVIQDDGRTKAASFFNCNGVAFRFAQATLFHEYA